MVGIDRLKSPPPFGRGGEAMILTNFSRSLSIQRSPSGTARAVMAAGAFPAVTGEAACSTEGESAHRIGSGGDLLT